MSIVLTALALVATQGQAVQWRIPARDDITAASVQWQGRSVPMTLVQDDWVVLLGVDLDTAPGDITLSAALTLRDGSHEAVRDTLTVSAGDYPVTRLTVDNRYVELSPENQQRAARESRAIAAIYSAISAEQLYSGPFISPVEGASGGRNFGYRRYFNDQARAPHSGADLRAALGTPIRASNRGRVVLAENLFFSGNAVFLDHGAGIYTVYLHLSQIDAEIGAIVEQGQVIGLAGATGRVTGPHLHWGVRVLDARIDPFTLPGLGRRSSDE